MIISPLFFLKTFSSLVQPRHQKWDVANNSNVRNLGAEKCLATGKEVYDGKAVSALDGC
jgi:hypothetical protein